MTGEAFHLVGPQMAAIFTLESDVWRAIDTRVAAAISLAPIADTVVHTLPNYRELLDVCQSFRSATWPMMQAQATGIADLASVAMTSYELLRKFVGTLGDKPLTPEQKSLVHDIVNPLSSLLASRRDTLNEVDAAMVRFSDVNQVTDARLKAIQGALGPEWTLIGKETGAIDTAIGGMRGEWSAVVSDFRALADGSLELTTAFLLGLSLESAVRGWQLLSTEATEFANKGLTASLMRRGAPRMAQEWRAR